MTKKILVVDDEPMCILFLGEYLKDNGYTIETSKDGDTAITLGKTLVPEVLITDWMLKDSHDGLDVALRLLEINPDLKVIFMTGMPAEALEEKITGLPLYKIVEKPINLDNIIKLIEEWK